MNWLWVGSSSRGENTQSTQLARACAHIRWVSGTCPPPPPFDSLVHLCFMQTSTMTKTIRMMRVMRITMTTATTTPMMTAVSTPPARPEGAGGDEERNTLGLDCYMHCCQQHTPTHTYTHTYTHSYKQGRRK